MIKKLPAFFVIMCFFFMTYYMEAASHKEHYERGKKAYKQRQYMDAYDNFQKAVAKKPDKAKYHYNLGLAARKLKRWQIALDSFKKARQLDPKMGFTKKHFEFYKKIEELEERLGGDTDDQIEPASTTATKDRAAPETGKKKKGGVPTWLYFVPFGLFFIFLIARKKKKGTPGAPPSHTTSHLSDRNGHRRHYHDDDYHSRDLYDDRERGYRDYAAGSVVRDSLDRDEDLRDQS